MPSSRIQINTDLLSLSFSSQYMISTGKLDQKMFKIIHFPGSSLCNILTFYGKWCFRSWNTVLWTGTFKSLKSKLRNVLGKQKESPKLKGTLFWWWEKQEGRCAQISKSKDSICEAGLHAPGCWKVYYKWLTERQTELLKDKPALNGFEGYCN